VLAVYLVRAACLVENLTLAGEDALANLSIEKGEDGTIQGHVRIRSKTQGIALSLGDKITLAQKAKV
jgi:coatomer subunit beta